MNFFNFFESIRFCPVKIIMWRSMIFQVSEQQKRLIQKQTCNQLLTYL